MPAIDSVPLAAAPSPRLRPVGPGTIAALVVAVAVSLLLLFPWDEYGGELRELDHPDEASLAYLRLRLRATTDSDARRVRLLLAKNAIVLGRLDEADDSLAPLLGRTDRDGRAARLIALEVRLHRWRALPADGPARRDTAAIDELLAGLLDEPLRPAELRRVLPVALELRHPDWAGEACLRMAGSGQEAPEPWQEQAAEHFLAAGMPARAATVMADVTAAKGASPEALDESRRAVLASLSAGDEAAARTFAAALKSRFGGDPAAYDTMVRTVLPPLPPPAPPPPRPRMVAAPSPGGPPQRPRSLRDLRGWEAYLAATLAVTDLKNALVAAKRVVALRPESVPAHRRLAQVAEWAGEPATALAAYAWLSGIKDRRQLHHEVGGAHLRRVRRHTGIGKRHPAGKHEPARVPRHAPHHHGRRPPRGLHTRRRHGAHHRGFGPPDSRALPATGGPRPPASGAPSQEQSAFDSAVRLATGLGDTALLAELLHRDAARRSIRYEELARLVNLDEVLGNSGRAFALVQGYLGRVPGERRAWVLEAQLHENGRDLASALAVWKEIGRRFGDDGATVRKRAELLWRLKRAPEALAELTRHAPRAEAGQSDFFALLAALAWDQNAPEVALDAYRALWRDKVIDVEGAERLARLLHERGKDDELVEVAATSWVRLQAHRPLLLAMETSAAQKEWSTLRRLFALAGKAPSQVLAGDLDFWMLRAQLDTFDGRLRDAAQDYNHALAIDDDSVPARSGWLVVSDHDPRQRNLVERIARWRADAETEPGLWSAFGLSCDRLGYVDEARRYYERDARAHPDNDLLLVAHADALEKAGRVESSDRLRRTLLERMGPRLTRLLRGRGGPVDEESRELVQAYAGLLYRAEGPAAARAWLRPLSARSSRTRDHDVDRMVLSWDLEEEDFESARRILLRREAAGRRVTASERLAVAMGSGDSATVDELVHAARDQLTAREAAGALVRLGDSRTAESVVREALASPRTSEEEAEALVAEYAELLVDRAGQIEAELRTASLGPLSARRAEVAGSFGAWLPLLLRPRLSLTDLRSERAQIDLEGAHEEVLAQLSAAFRQRRGETELTAGVNWRVGDSLLPVAGLSQSYRPLRGLEGEVHLRLNEVTEDNHLLRAGATRSRAGLSLAWQPTGRAFVNVEADAQQYRARDWGLVGQGLAGWLTVGHRLLLDRPQLWLRLQGSLAANVLADVLPQALARRLPSDFEPDDVLPPLYGSAGLGFTLATGPREAALRPGRVHAELDGWAGWMGPPHRFAYEGRGSLAVGVPGGGALALGALYASDRAAGFGQPYYSIDLRYTLRFAR